MSRTTPPWFEPIRARAEEGWNRREGTEDEGVWLGLFRQIQSPAHVISELLQNADDAGATRAAVRVDAGMFLFEHDGNDFDESDFGSLCSFGSSNKRSLWTVGFRGMGFKSLFSLGDEVRLTTPTLAIRFTVDRFTQPHWIDARSGAEAIRIEIPLRDHEVTAEIERQIGAWQRSPLPVLFFRNVRRLTLGEKTFERVPEGSAPVAGGGRVSLSGTGLKELLLLPLRLDGLPDECIEEILRERGGNASADRTRLSSLEATIVFGSRVDRKLFVVLPTRVSAGLPFALNAPFIQDPARTGLKDLSLSLFNRWLLERTGEAAGRRFLEWLGNEELPLERRAEAYGLVSSPTPGDGITPSGKRAHEYFVKGFRSAVEGQSLALTAGGRLVTGDEVVNLPGPALQAWNAAQLSAMFCDPGKETLAREAAPFAARLEKWDWVPAVDDGALWSALADSSTDELPRPESTEALWELWNWFGEMAPKNTFGWRGQEERIRSYWRSALLVPVGGSARLGRATELVRLPGKVPEDVTQEQWQDLCALVDAVDPTWIEFMERRQTGGASEGSEAFRGWERLGFGNPSRVEDVWRLAARFVFSEGEPQADQVLPLLTVAANRAIQLTADDASTIRLPCRDGHWKPLNHGLLLLDPELEELLPGGWVEEHGVDDGFLSHLHVRDRERVLQWLRDPGSSRVGTAPLPSENLVEGLTEECVRERYESRGLGEPEFPYQRGRLRMTDFDFAGELWEMLEDGAEKDPSVWSRFLGRLMQVSPTTLVACSKARVERAWGDNWRTVEPLLPAGWIVRMRGKPCLRDEKGNPREPVEILVPTEENRAFAEVEDLLHPAFYRQDLTGILDDLGIRQFPGRWGAVVSRLEQLGRVPEPPPKEVYRLYSLLDRIVSTLDRDDPEQLAELRAVFADRKLVLSTEGWENSGGLAQENPDEIPGIPLIHESVRTLGLWSYLGVREHPTQEDALKWFAGLPIGEPLGDVLPRAAEILRRFPKKILDRTEVWLTLDGALRPLEEVRWRALGSAVPVHLDWSVRSATADVEGIRGPMPRPLYNLPSITSRLRCEIVGGVVKGIADGNAGHWLSTVGNLLQGVAEARENPGEPSRIQAGLKEVRSLGRKLVDARLLVCEHPSVRFLIGGNPVSAACSVRVAWNGRDLVLDSDPGPDLQEDVVAELCQRLDASSFRRLFDHCYCRDEDWIRREVGVHFVLEDAGVEPISDPEVAPPGPVVEDEENGGNSGGKGRKKLYDLLADAGFRKNEEGIWERKTSGEKLWKTRDDPFLWGYSSTRLGRRKACLVRGDFGPGARFTLPYDAWEQGHRQEAVLVMVGSGTFEVREFSDLEERLERGGLELHPERVRLVWLGRDEEPGTIDSETNGSSEEA